MGATSCTGTSTVPCAWQDNTFATNLTGYYVQPSALYVDAASNVYFVNVYDNTSKGAYNRVMKFNALSSPGTGTLLADNLTANIDATLALDGAGKLYYGDGVTGGGNGKVSLISGGALGTAVGTTATITAAQIASATGVAGDIFGNIYISSTTQVSEVPYEATALNFTDEFVITTALTNTITYGGSLDQNGNYYYASATNIQQVQVGGYNFGQNADRHPYDLRHDARRAQPDALLQLRRVERFELFPNRLAHVEHRAGPASELPVLRHQVLLRRHQLYRRADRHHHDELRARPHRPAQRLVHAAHRRRQRHHRQPAGRRRGAAVLLPSGRRVLALHQRVRQLHRPPRRSR